MNDKNKLFADAREFNELVEWLMEEMDIDKATAQHMVQYSEHKSSKRLLAAWMKKRGNNAKQLGGEMDQALRDEGEL